MEDSLDIQNLLQTGYFTTSRAKTSVNLLLLLVRC